MRTCNDMANGARMEKRTSSGEKDRVPSLDARSMMSAGGRPRSNGTASSHRACMYSMLLQRWLHVTGSETAARESLQDKTMSYRESSRDVQTTHLGARSDVSHERRAHQRQQVGPVLRASLASVCLPVANAAFRWEKANLWANLHAKTGGPYACAASVRIVLGI